MKFFEIFDRTCAEARLAVLVDAVSQVLNENFNLASLFLDYLVRGLALDDARRRLSRCARRSRALSFLSLAERSVGPHHVQVFIRTRAQEIRELLALRASYRAVLVEKDGKLILEVFGIYLREDALTRLVILDRFQQSPTHDAIQNLHLPRAQRTVLCDRFPIHAIEEFNACILTTIALVKRIDLLRRNRLVAPPGAF